MTIPGVDMLAAVSIVAAVGDFCRFASADKLVACLGLNPRVRQSGNTAPVHGRMTKAGRAQARGMLVEAAWAAVRAPGPLRAFYHRVRARRGFQIAVAAAARKITVLAWHLITTTRTTPSPAPASSPTNDASSSSPPDFRPTAARTGV
jgi:transposase